MKNWQKIRDGHSDPKVFLQRSCVLDRIRAWFRRQSFLEVETPLLLKFPGMEPHLNLFASDYISHDGKNTERRYLHTSPEYSMKKLLGAGFEKIYQISKVFRNGEWIHESSQDDPRHNPEFTLLEWYRSDSDYLGMMDDTESLTKSVVQGVDLSSGVTDVIEQDWERLSVRDAFLRYAELNLDELRDLEDLKFAVEQKNYTLKATYSWDDLFFLIMLNEVEPKLGFDRPVFLYDYPSSQAALAKKRDDDPFWAERFELYINGVELCNAFSELIDPVEQRERLIQEQDERRQMGKEVYEIDEDFLEALTTMPPSGGNALGIDRLVMVLLEKKSIEDVLLFPWGD